MYSTRKNQLGLVPDKLFKPKPCVAEGPELPAGLPEVEEMAPQGPDPSAVCYDLDALHILSHPAIGEVRTADGGRVLRDVSLLTDEFVVGNARSSMSEFFESLYLARATSADRPAKQVSRLEEIQAKVSRKQI